MIQLLNRLLSHTVNEISVDTAVQAANYTNVHNLNGGIFEWVNQGYKVKNHTGYTNKVHTFNEFWSQWLLRGEKIY